MITYDDHSTDSIKTLAQGGMALVLPVGGRPSRSFRVLFGSFSVSLTCWHDSMMAGKECLSVCCTVLGSKSVKHEAGSLCRVARWLYSFVLLQFKGWGSSASRCGSTGRKWGPTGDHWVSLMGLHRGSLGFFRYFSAEVGPPTALIVSGQAHPVGFGYWHCVLFVGF